MSMCRFIEAGRVAVQAIKHPALWIALVAWGTLTAFVYLLTPIAPVYQFEPDPTERTNPWKNLPYTSIDNRFVPGSSNDGTTIATSSDEPAGSMGSFSSSHSRLNIRDGKLLNQFFTNDDYPASKSSALSGDGMRGRSGGNRVLQRREWRQNGFLTAPIPTFANHTAAAGSPSEEHLASVLRSSRAELQLLRRQPTRLRAERASIWLHGFSACDRWLIIEAPRDGQSHLNCWTWTTD